MMEQVRIEEFVRDGKSFIYIDFSNLKTNEEFIELLKVIEPAFAKYPKHSLYTITNIENVRIDSESKKIIAQYLEHNKPYVKCGAVIGLDGIKKIIVTTALKLSGRDNIFFAFTKEQAVELLLQKELVAQSAN
ncbi:MAG: hypothetical protein FWF38_02640 [Spirochaetaceae bacterium]|nr:hypothetical protein [Spirochaetaceae bacterium]